MTESDAPAHVSFRELVARLSDETLRTNAQFAELDPIELAETAPFWVAVRVRSRVVTEL